MTGLILSCKSTTKNELEYGVSDRYAVEINTWGMPGSDRFQVRYNNLPDSPHANEGLLYVIRHSVTQGKTTADTVAVHLNPAQWDSISHFTQQYLQDFEVDNRYRIGTKEHPVEVIYDGSSFSVAFEHNNKRLQASQYHVKGFEEASPAMGRLMSLINSKLPQEFKVY